MLTPQLLTSDVKESIGALSNEVMKLQENCIALHEYQQSLFKICQSWVREGAQEVEW